MATNSLGQGNGKYIVAMAYIGPSRTSYDVTKHKPGIVAFKSGTKLSIPFFACDTEKDIQQSLKALVKFVKKLTPKTKKRG